MLNGKRMRPLHTFSVALSSMLIACGPSETDRAGMVEQRRIECLDKFCEGDVEPKRDMATEAALKLNGQWYVGPKEYFSSLGRAEFEWWEHKPVSASMKRPPEMQALASAGKGYDYSIEIFLNRPKGTPPYQSLFQTLLDLEAKRLVLEKASPRPGLQVWRTQEQGRLPETWYVATDLRLPTNEPPVVVCRGDEPTKNRCSGGFLWTPQIAAGVRFRATHAPDWPEIYLEIHRILLQLRKG